MHAPQRSLGSSRSALVRLVLAAALAAACGEDEGGHPPAVVDAGPPERLPENGARTDPGAPCTTGVPAASGLCALPFEETSLEIVSASSTTADGCTQLYVASRVAGDPVARVRRYRMTGVDVCGFARDEGFGEVRANLSAISATDDGAVFALGYRVVRRIAPGPPVDCVARDVTLGDRVHLAVAPSGRIGYVTWSGRAGPGAGLPEVAKLTNTADGCELTALPTDAFASGGFRRVGDLAVDRSDRLHVLVAREKYPDQDVLVVDAEGRLVTRFDPADSAQLRDTLDAITPCGAGMCILGFQSRAAFGPEGEPVAWERLGTTPEEPLPCRAFVGSAGGPLFCLGIGSGSRPGMRAKVIKLP